MTSYGGIAAYYDRLDAAANDAPRFELCLSLLDKDKPLLDAGCGTGSFTLAALKRGFSTISVDISPDMLSIAAQKAQKYSDALFLNQDITKLDLYGAVGGCVCLRDTLNHIKGKKGFLAAIARIALFCERGSHFIFDLNTPYKHRSVLGDSSFTIEREGLFCCVRSELYSDCSVTLTTDLFVERGGAYERIQDRVREYIHENEFVIKTLADCGFSLVDTLDGETLKAPTDRSERLLYIARKS